MSSIAARARSWTARRRSSSAAGSLRPPAPVSGRRRRLVGARLLELPLQLLGRVGAGGAGSASAAGETHQATPRGNPNPARKRRIRGRCYSSADFSPRSRADPFPVGAGTRGRLRPREGATRERERLRDSADARSGDSGGAPRRDHRPHARADREGRRHLALPRRRGAGAGSPTRSTTRPTASTTCSSSTPSRRRWTRCTRVLKITDGVMRHMATRRPKGGGRVAPPPPLPAPRSARARARGERPPGARSRGSRGRTRPSRPRRKPPIRRVAAEEYAEPTGRRVGGAGGGAGGGGLAWRTSTASSSSGT